MPPASLFKELLRAVTPPLKALGFSREGQVYRLQHGGNWAIIAFQTSVRSSVRHVNFTINLGISSGRLAEFFTGNRPEKPTLGDCHWRGRIGHLLPTRRDTWWTIEAETSLPQLTQEITAVLLDRAVPVLERLVSDEALRDLWLSEGSQQLRNLAILLKKLGPDDRLEPILQEWRRSAQGTPNAHMIESYIQRLLQESGT